ncbi:hypothetical protein [Parapedobacter sp. 10938]|uniref:hypothetical protein n=1 Tax=Parapedobacter flavus TaxID=3110225 RepID=UPI002DBB6E8A|nr:hypothetical protein [Parapedobacter sp. 10938]MEC3878805.1 hypothetical protein [Parapedobacter sp. 10938]
MIRKKLKTNSMLMTAVCLSLGIVMGCSSKAKKETPVVESSMRYLENDRLKLGIDLGLGGAVTFLSDQENGGKNMVNSFDWGRQIQLSFYSGPWPYIGPNGETPTPEWAGLGWNPIQSGDAGGHRSKILSFEQRGDNAFFVRSIPMQWPHKTGVAGDCEFECLYTLEGNVITMEAAIVNKRTDHTQYRASGQEMPAVYTNGPWYQLVTYLGDKPFTGEPTTTVVDKGDHKGWPWVHFYTPENWVALLDENGYGIGVFQPEAMTFNGGFHPNDESKGVGGEKDAATGHIAPTGRQILDHNIRWSYKTSLVLGTLDDIRGYAEANWEVVPQPQWSFNDSRDNWYYEGEIKDAGFPIEGKLDVQFQSDATLVGPATFWEASKTPFLEIEGAFETASGELVLSVDVQPVSPADFTDWLNWSEGAHDVDAERKQKASEFPEKPVVHTEKTIVADGQQRTYRIHLAETAGYTGAMKSMRISLSERGSAKVTRIGLGE